MEMSAPGQQKHLSNFLRKEILMTCNQKFNEKFVSNYLRHIELLQYDSVYFSYFIIDHLHMLDAKFDTQT